MGMPTVFYLNAEAKSRGVKSFPFRRAMDNDDTWLDTPHDREFEIVRGSLGTEDDVALD